MRRTSVLLKVKEAQNYEAHVLLDLLLEARTFMNQKKLIFPALQTYDLKKETVSFMRYIDYARSQNYILRDIIQFEVTSAFFS